jgi:hypothetical protein
MAHVALVCCALLAAAPAAPEPDTRPPASGYAEAQSHFGGDAAGQVKLALWCEANGLPAERVKHLARAVILDPANVTARGLLGLVGDGGRWQRPEALAEKVKADAALTAALAEYNERRAQTSETADAQWKLALWCESKGLHPEAVAHLTAVTRLDPGKVAAWKRLGYRLHGGRWMTEEEIAAGKLEADAQARADRSWRPRLDRLKGLLAYKDPARRAKAEATIAEVTNPRAVPSVLAVFGHGGEGSQRLAVQLLGQIDAPASSRALAELAVRSPSDAVRRAAADTLRRRDPRDFLGLLIARLRDPIKYYINPVGGPGQPGELLIEGERFYLDRVYSPPERPVVPLSPGSRLDLDEAGMLVVWVANAVPGTAVLNSLTPALTWAMITGNLNPVFQTQPTPPARWIEEMMQPRGPRQVAAVIAALLGANSGLAAVPFIINPRAMWVASPDGLQTQAPIAPGSVAWSVNMTGETAMPQPPIAVPIGRMNAEIERAAYQARGQQREDVRVLERENAFVRKANDPVHVLLASLTGRNTSGGRTDWERWWTDQRGYAYASRSAASKPTVVRDVPLDYTPQPIGRFRYDREIGYFTTPSSSCFAAGTPVRTLTGPRPIDEVKVGDRVLAQDPRTGALGFHPVLDVAHNLPAPTLRVVLEGKETVVATPIHRFWKAQHGWVMARDLKPGDPVRTLGGLAKVVAVEPDATRPVFNLEVASGHDFFVGTSGALVHDNTLVEPVTEPFDAEPSLASASPPKADRAE